MAATTPDTRVPVTVLTGFLDLVDRPLQAVAMLLQVTEAYTAAVDCVEKSWYPF